MQKQLSHTRPGTTLENYMKEIPESVYATADAMYEQMAGADLADWLAKAHAAGGMQ